MLIRIASAAWLFAASINGAAAQSSDIAGWNVSPATGGARDIMCEMSRGNDRGETLMLALDGAGNVGVGLAGIPAPQTDGVSLLHYRLNDDVLLGGPASNGPDDSLMAWFDGPDYPRLLVPFVRDGRATIHLAGERASFDLPSAGRALTALVDCVYDAIESSGDERTLSFPILGR